MHRYHIAFVLAVLLIAGAGWPQETVPARPATPAGAAAAKPADAKPAPLYDEKADVKELIATALAKAKKDNRRVLIQWGGNWCGWCIRLHGLYKSDKDIGRKLMYEYDVVYADAGKPEGKNLDLAESYGADLKKHGFPYLTVLDADGKVLANQDTGSLEIEGAKAAPWHDPKLVLDFLTKHQAPYLDAQKILDAGLNEASQSGKRVFLHFGAPWCGWCHRLEDWMARKDLNAILAKDFVDVKIDIDRTIGGEELHAKFNSAGKGGIPWFVFLDSTGRPLIDSNSPKGNVGFPAAPEEISHFKAMLEKVAVNLTAHDIDSLTKSLAKKE